MRTLAAAAVALVLLTGCSASGDSGSETSSSRALASGQGTTAPDPFGPGMTLVGANLAEPGASGFGDVVAKGEFVAASTYTTTGDDTDVGLVYSPDGGRTWSRGGKVPLPGNQQISGVMVTDTGLVLVGATGTKKGDSYVNEALIVEAAAPDYAPRIVPTPKEFRGNVRLNAIFTDATDWVIIGSTSKPEGGRSKGTHDFPTVWRSPDKGTTWSRDVLRIKGSADTPVYSFTMGPDGSWNLFGQSHPGRGDQQFNASWLQSTDGGTSFRLMYPTWFAKNRDQGARFGVFSASGAVAIDGWDEVDESSATDSSVAWVGSAGEHIQALGKGTIPLQGGAPPPGEFLDGLIWDNETLVMWGSADGSYPMSEVQFWKFDGSTFVPSTTLPGNGALIGVQHIVDNGGSILAFGTTGPDAHQRNLAVWVGSLAK
jgi:hypothetical protein